MDDKQATAPRPAGRKLPWMKSAVSKKRGGEEAPAGTSKAAATKTSRPAAKRAKTRATKTKPKDDDSYREDGEEEEKGKSEEEHEEQAAPPQPQPEAEAVSPAKSEKESPTETRKKAVTKRKAENMIKALEGKASCATVDEPVRTLPKGRRTVAAAKAKAVEATKVARTVPTVEEDEDRDEAFATPPSRGGALALDELPTQTDVPLLATTATQLDIVEAPTQADSPAPPSRGRAKTRPSSRSRSRSRSPSLSPNPVSHYLDLLEEATQPDSSAFLSPLQSSPSSSAVPSQLATPPRSPLIGAHMLEAPTQFDGPPRSPFSLSPVPSPVRRGKRDANRPTAQGRKHKKLLTSIIAAAAVSSSPVVTSTTITPSSQQRRRLMSQATQPDLFASPSASQGDSSVVYDDDEDLDAVLGRPTQTEDTCSPVDLLGRPTQADGCTGGLSPIRPRGRAGARATPQPSPLGVKAGGPEDSLETSLLLLDASTQEDDVDDADCSPFQQRGGDSDAEDHNGEEDESDSDASPVNARSRRAAAKPRQFDASFVLGPTQTDSPLSGSSAASQLLRAATQPDLASSTAATQLDQSLLILSDSMEAESLGSIPTQIDGFALMGSAPTQADDLRQGSRYSHLRHDEEEAEEDPTQIDAVHGQPTQIDSLPTQLDVDTLSASTPNRKRKQKADARSQQRKQQQQQKPLKKRRSTDDADAAAVMAMAEAPTLVEALHYDPTPPLDLEGESPGFEGPKSRSRKRPTGAREDPDEEEAEERSTTSASGPAPKRRRSKEEATTSSRGGGRNRRSSEQDEDEDEAEEEEEPLQEGGSQQRKKARVADSSTQSRPGTGERPSPDDEDEAEAPFGRLMSLNPKYPNVAIPESGVLMGRHTTECHPKCRYKGSHISTRHCRVSVVRRRAAAAQGDESNSASPSLDPAPADAPLCRYGATCYRKNPQHLQQYRHPRPPPAAAPAAEFDLVVLDLSTNGTFINDTLIGKNKKRKLMPGQELSLVMSVTERPVDAQLELIAYRYEP